MSVVDATPNPRVMRKKRNEANRERLLKQMGGGAGAARTVLTAMSPGSRGNQSPGGTTLLRVGGGT